MATQETTYYEKGTVKITNARAMMGTNTYPMTNITSVGMGTDPAQRGLAALLIALGVIAGLWGLLQLVGSMAFGGRLHLPTAEFVIAAILLGVGVLSWRAAQATHFVKLGAAGGEQRAYVSTDKTEIQGIVNALNEAIVRRG